LICSNSVYIFPFVNGSATISTNLSDGYGNVPQVLDSYTYEIELHDPGYKTNIPFWNALRHSNDWRLVYKTETTICEAPISAMWFPVANVQADIKSKIDIMVKSSFIVSDLLVPVAAPAGIFTECITC
jgi:hypothetical protein